MPVDNNSLSTQTITCTYCNSNNVNSLSDILIHLYNNFDNINKGFQYWQKHEGYKCNICQSQQTITRNISNSYNLFAFALEHSNIAINKTVQVQKPNNSFSLIPLKGIIYIGNNHFTARIIDAKKNVWFYDGISTGKTCRYEKSLSAFTEKKLMTCDNNQAVLAIYARK